MDQMAFILSHALDVLSLPLCWKDFLHTKSQKNVCSSVCADNSVAQYVSLSETETFIFPSAAAGPFWNLNINKAVYITVYFPYEWQHLTSPLTFFLFASLLVSLWAQLCPSGSRCSNSRFALMHGVVCHLMSPYVLYSPSLSVTSWVIYSSHQSQQTCTYLYLMCVDWSKAWIYFCSWNLFLQLHVDMVVVVVVL